MTATRVYKYGAILKMQNALSDEDKKRFDAIKAKRKKGECRADFWARLSSAERNLLKKGTELPEAAIEELFRSNQLWNDLVALHNKHRDLYEQARCKADKEYKKICLKLDKMDESIKKAFADKRMARVKAGTRDAKDPLIAEENEKIKKLKSEQRQLWKDARPARLRADKLIDKKGLNDAFKTEVKEAQRVENCGINGSCANEIARYFKTARAKAFKDRAKLRFHRFDGTGFWFYRFREDGKDITTDGVPFTNLLTGNKTEENDRRPFVLTEKESKKNRTTYKLRVKLAGGAKNDSKVYGHFDLILHRPIPDKAQIQNAKLVRKRTGDKFHHTVSFTLRLPDTKQQVIEAKMIGMDLGFRELEDEAGTKRIATLAAIAFNSRNPRLPEKTGKPEFINLPKGRRNDYLQRMEFIENTYGEIDKSATELGEKLLPLIKAAKPLPEAHKKFGFVKKLKNMKKNVTLDRERAYKMARWLMAVPEDEAHFGPEISNLLHDWWSRNSLKYRETHNLRRKALANRKEFYRCEAARIVAKGLPIAVEKLRLDKMAEVKEKDNKLASKALSNRFQVAPSEFRDALKNAAEREGITVVEVSAAYTSKDCSACGVRNKELRGEEKWQCPECRIWHDRDVNAAVNIARRGYEELQKMYKKQKEKDKE